MSESFATFRRTTDMIMPILETQFIGLSRVLIGLPIEHFFDRFKTLMQANQTGESFKQLLKNIIKQQGFLRGIFAGFSSQITLQVSKQYYRWPMMILIPKHIKEQLPASVVKRHPVCHKLLTGVSIAMFESLIICPIERVKCQLMTQNLQQAVIRNLYRKERRLFPIMKHLYTGINITMLKQVVSWTNYMYWDHKTRYLFKEAPHSALTYTQCLICSVLSAIPNILFVQPFDTMKTLYQMEKNQQYKGLNIINAMRKLYVERGINGFYAGWNVRLSQFIISAILTTPVIDYLERLHGLSSN